MAHRPGDKLLGAYVSPAFAEAAGLVAKAAGKSKSDLVRDSLTKQLNSVDRLAESLTPDDDGDCLLRKSDDLRHTLVPITPDEMGTDPDGLQKAVWGVGADRDRSVLDADGRDVGWVTESGYWSPELGSFPVAGTDGVLRKAANPGTAVLGIQWTPEAWRELNAGTLSPNDLAKAKLFKSASAAP